MLDTGAKPSVIDRNTLGELNLEKQLVKAPGKVYGLCNSPVRVLGYVDALIQVGDETPVMQRLHVLDNNERTLLLGRQFMENFDELGIKFGKEWQPAQTMLRGSISLARATTIREEALEIQDDSNSRALINPELSPNQNKQVIGLLSNFRNCLQNTPRSLRE